MKRSEIFAKLNEIEDVHKDFAKILTNLHYTHHFMMDKYKKMLSDFDLTLIQSNVLGIIACYGEKGASLEDVKEMVLEPNSDVSRTVARLVSKDFVQKVANADNRRKVQIRVLPKGQEIIKSLDAISFRKITAQLSLEEARAFASILEKLRNAPV
jgi:DNA-binding MarR family transcriptional regulator